MHDETKTPTMKNKATLNDTAPNEWNRTRKRAHEKWQGNDVNEMPISYTCGGPQVLYASKLNARGAEKKAPIYAQSCL